MTYKINIQCACSVHDTLQEVHIVTSFVSVSDSKEYKIYFRCLILDAEVSISQGIFRLAK